MLSICWTPLPKSEETACRPFLAMFVESLYRGFRSEPIGFVLTQKGGLWESFLACLQNVGRICAQERKFTGFVEKDSAGQQNIYSVEVRFEAYTL